MASERVPATGLVIVGGCRPCRERERERESQSQSGLRPYSWLGYLGQVRTPPPPPLNLAVFEGIVLRTTHRSTQLLFLAREAGDLVLSPVETLTLSGTILTRGSPNSSHGEGMIFGLWM